MNRLLIASSILMISAAAVGGTAVPDITGGTYTFTVTGDDTYGDKLTGAINVVKKGAGKLTLTAANDFTGTIVIEAGTLVGSIATAKTGGFGNPSSVTVEEGATMEIRDALNHFLQTTALTIGGTGVGGSGALRVTSGTSNNYGFNAITLTADTLLDNPVRFGPEGGDFNFNGYTFTKKGTGTFTLQGCAYKAGDPQDGSRHAAFRLQAGSLTAVNNPSFPDGTAENKFILDGGTGYCPTFSFWANAATIPWTLDCGAGAVRFSADKNDATARTYTWSGPVICTNTASSKAIDIVQTEANKTFVFSGPIVSVKQVSANGRTASTETTTISGIISNTAGTVVYRGNLDLTGKGAHRLAGGMGAYGQSEGIPATLRLLDMGTVDGNRSTCNVNGTQQSPAECVISNTSGFVGSLIRMGERPRAKNILNIQGDSILTNLNIYMGVPTGWGTATYGTNTQNAVYMAGGEIHTRNAGDMDFWMSNDYDSYGYFGMTGGKLTSYNFKMGGPQTFALGWGGPSVVHLKGGTVTTGNATLSHAGRDSVFYVKNGAQCTVDGGNFYLGRGGTSTDWSHKDGEALLAVCGTGTVMSLCYVINESPADFVSTVVINDGALVNGRPCFERLNDGKLAGVNHAFHFAANGGRLETSRGDIAFFSDFTSNYGDTSAVLYEHGLTVNVSSNTCLHRDGYHRAAAIAADLSSPTGRGLVSIALPTDAEFLSAKYVGAPIVRITDTTGKGAAAVAEFDETTRRVTGITVLAGGFGYSDNPEVKICSPDHAKTYACTATVGELPKTGGLTKTGDGELEFRNGLVTTYLGPTRILGGTLRFGLDSIPTNSAFFIAKGAVLDMMTSGIGRRTFSLKSLAGSGRIAAGVTTAGSQGPREFTFREGFELTAGEPVVTDGAIGWGPAATLKVTNPGALDGATGFVELLRADAGLKGDPSELTLVGLDPEKWKLSVRGNRIGVHEKAGMIFFVR